MAGSTVLSKSRKKTAKLVLNTIYGLMPDFTTLNETKDLIRQNKNLNSLLPTPGHFYYVLLFTWKGGSYLLVDICCCCCFFFFIFVLLFFFLLNVFIEEKTTMHERLTDHLSKTSLLSILSSQERAYSIRKKCFLT